MLGVGAGPLRPNFSSDNFALGGTFYISSPSCPPLSAFDVCLHGRYWVLVVFCALEGPALEGRAWGVWNGGHLFSLFQHFFLPRKGRLDLYQTGNAMSRKHAPFVMEFIGTLFLVLIIGLATSSNTGPGALAPICIGFGLLALVFAVRGCDVVRCGAMWCECECASASV